MRHGFRRRKRPGNTLLGREQGRDKEFLETMEADVPAAAVPVTQGLGINLQLSQWDSLEIVPPWITFN